MDFLVRVKQGHPTGVRRRSGLTFTREETRLTEGQLTKDICEDAWLEGRPAPDITPPADTPPPTGDAPLSDEERQRLTEFADKLHQDAIDESDAASARAAAAGGADGQGKASAGDGKDVAAADGKNGDGREGRKRKAH